MIYRNASVIQTNGFGLEHIFDLSGLPKILQALAKIPRFIISMAQCDDHPTISVSIDLIQAFNVLSELVGEVSNVVVWFINNTCVAEPAAPVKNSSFKTIQLAEPYEESTYARYKDIYNILDDTYVYIVDHSFTYLNVIAFIGIAIFVVVLIYFLSIALSYSIVDETIEKNSTYECGFIPFSDSRIRFDISFYVVSLLFVIFDLELVFLLPWSTLLQSMTIMGFFSMVLFFKLLLIGFIFEWKRGALDI